ncbi:prepilin peptidase [Patescibacteria group bacterium]|nr:prepilin peptidase [Patescibacteria group bacterium]
MIFSFCFGAIIGSFINSLIWRLHENKSILDRSCCPKCKKKIAWYDNIPVLSFIILHGKCRYCKKRISWQYPIVEIITGILFVVVYLNNSQFFTLQITDYRLLVTILRDWFIISVMIIVFIYDLRWYLILLDKIILPASVIVLVVNLFLGFNWLNLLFSAIIGSGFFLIQFLISKGKWIGAGDIGLGLFIGLALARWDYLIIAIMLAYVLGSIVGVILILIGRKQWGSQMPFGVFLAISTIITIFWGEKILAFLY